MDVNDRTPAVGLFNTARSYWRSAVALHEARVKVTHPQAPVTFLFCHGIELYLKSFLRAHGCTLEVLKSIGHNIARLAEEAQRRSLKLSPETTELLAHVREEDVAMEARYIVTGFKQAPTAEVLSSACEELDRSICDSLVSRGEPVRHETFDPVVVPSSDLEPEEQRILGHLFQARDYDDFGLPVIASRAGLDEGFARYYLDQLEERGFASLGSFNTISGIHYWGITPAGRTYAVRHKLVSPPKG